MVGGKEVDDIMQWSERLRAMGRRLRDTLQRLLIGRNGADALSTAALAAGVLLSLLSRLRGWSGLYLLSLLALGYALFRVFSRNIPKRREENDRFCGWFRTFRSRLTDREHRYYRCPQCRQTIRVPRGKGTLLIRCPKCQRQFEKKT